MKEQFSNFFIGFFAALCAVFVPRMLAMLNAGGGELDYFKWNYVVLGLIFAVIIGVITVIFQQGKKKSAADTFMTALGIPALLAGALNTGTVSNELSSLEASNRKLTETLSQKSGVQIDESGVKLVPLQAPDMKQSSSGLPLFGFSLISSAMAQDNAELQPAVIALNIGLQAEQRRYVVVLGKASSQEEAQKIADALRGKVPGVTVMRAEQEYIVVESATARSRPDALLQAMELQKAGMSPSLLLVK